MNSQVENEQDYLDSTKESLAKKGQDILIRLTSSLRTAQIFEPNNSTLIRQVSILFTFIQDSLQNEGEAILQLRENTLFFNSVRIKFDFSTYEHFKFFATELKKKEIGALIFDTGLIEEELKAFIVFLANAPEAEDHPFEDLQDLSAHFQLTCLEVKSRIVPDWSDDLARNIGEYNDLLDLRLKIRADLLERAQHQADAEYAQQVIEATIEGATISYPPILLRDEVGEMRAELERRLKGQNLSLEDYLKIEKKTDEELRSELEPRAKERLDRALILGKLVEVEELEVGEEEVNSEIDRIIAPFKDQSEDIRKSFDNPMSRRHLTLDLLTTKAIKHLVAFAKGESGPVKETIVEKTSEVPPPEGVPDEDSLSKE